MIARGTVTAASGGFVHAEFPCARIGAGVRIETARGSACGEIVAVHGERASIAMHGALDAIGAGSAVVADPRALALVLGTVALGRAIDPLGRPLDDGPALDGARVPLVRAAPAPAARAPIVTPWWTGVRVIDGLLTIGRGARIGIFGAPGAGKSTLLRCLASGIGADASVIALVGERGREAQEWIAHRDARTSIICATSDRPPAERTRALRAALAQADALRRRGLDVLLVVDSLARFCAAQRELALACAESVGRGGYPASVFAELARCVEIAGPAHSGSITLIATVLDDGDARDPVSDAARSLLDGHVALSPQLARAHRFPAVDVGASASRTMNDVIDDAHRRAAATVRRAIELLERTADARALGIAGSRADLARAVAAQPVLDDFLLQDARPAQPARMLAELAGLADMLEGD